MTDTTPDVTLRLALLRLNEFFGDPQWHLANWRRNAEADAVKDETFNAHPLAILALLDVVDASMALAITWTDTALDARKKETE